MPTKAAWPNKVRPPQPVRRRSPSAARAPLVLFLFDFFLCRTLAHRLPDQNRDQRPEDEDLLERAVEKRGIAFEHADQDGADGGCRIADQTTDDRADERLKADEESGVVIERSDRPDQDTGDAGKRGGEQEGGCPGRRGVNPRDTRATQ